MENPTSRYSSARDAIDSIEGWDCDSLDRLAEEFAARCRNGESPSIAEYEARYPDAAPRVRNLLEAVAMMEQLRRDSRRTHPLPERFGEFRIIRELGRGGMGVVYEAAQESLGRHVAVKAIHHVQMDAKRLQRFRLETQAIARLHHTNIVPIFGVGEHEGLPYYAMQYIQGSSLEVLLNTWREGKAPRSEKRWRMVAELGVQAAEALQYAHEQGVLHRDIKPANLLVDELRTVWITDFGLAKLVGGEDLTASGDVIGTLRYLAPEALHGKTDARSDVYSLGLTLYELLTLSVPFGDLSPSELLRQVRDGTLTLPRRLDPSIPRDLETIVLKAIAREPAHRYQTAGELASDLRHFLEDRPIHARRVTAIERAWRWSRRNRAIAALIATAAALLLVASALGWIGYVGATNALARETGLLKETEAANRRAEANVALSLEVFGDLFEKLAPTDQVASPPLGLLGRRRPRGPEGPGSGPGRGRRPMDEPFGGGFGRRGGGPGGFGPPPDDEPGGPRRGAPGPPDEVMGRFRPRGSESDTSLLESVLTFYDRFARQNAQAKNPKLQGEAAWAYRKVGALYHNLGRDHEAAEAYARAIAMFEDLAKQVPANPEIRFNLVATYLMSDPWTADPADLPKIERHLSRALPIMKSLTEESPENFLDAQAMLQVEAKLGAALQRLDRPDDAEDHFRNGLQLAGSLIERSPGFFPWRLDRVAILEAIAGLHIADGRKTDAIKDLEAIADDLRTLESQRRMAHPVADHLNTLSKMYEMLGETAKAEAITTGAETLDSRPSGGDHSGPPDEPPGRRDRGPMRPRPTGKGERPPFPR